MGNSRLGEMGIFGPSMYVRGARLVLGHDRAELIWNFMDLPSATCNDCTFPDQSASHFFVAAHDDFAPQKSKMITITTRDLLERTRMENESSKQRN